MAPEPIRIANCSGFFGDRPSGAREMVEGGPIDVLTGDWLAELTMLILSRIQAKNPGTGLRQDLRRPDGGGHGHLPRSRHQGGLQRRRARPRWLCPGRPGGGGQARPVPEGGLGRRRRPPPPSRRSWSTSGDLQPLRSGPDTGQADLGDTDRYLTANAYLGCWGIVEALEPGGRHRHHRPGHRRRRGPAALRPGTTAGLEDDFDQLAGAVVAGHVIECSGQATGGNYSFFHEIEGYDDQAGGRARFGFPWAEVAADGSTVIGKHDGTGGTVNVETVTSQILYEIGGPEYLGPDVTARFDTIELEQVAPDRVRISTAPGPGPTGHPEGGHERGRRLPQLGHPGPHRARRRREGPLRPGCVLGRLPLRADDFDSIVSRVILTNKPDPASQEEATAIWRPHGQGPRRAQGRPGLLQLP